MTAFLLLSAPQTPLSRFICLLLADNSHVNFISKYRLGKPLGNGSGLAIRTSFAYSVDRLPKYPTRAVACYVAAVNARRMTVAFVPQFGPLGYDSSHMFKFKAPGASFYRYLPQSAGDSTDPNFVDSNSSSIVRLINLWYMLPHALLSR